MTDLERCLAYLAKLPPAVSGSGGHNAALRAACECVRFGLTDSEALQALGEFNRRCAPPWSEHELAHKLASARRLAASQAGQRGRGGTRKRMARARVFDHGALERALAARRPAVPPIPAPVATHPADAMRAALAAVEARPDWSAGVAIVRQPVDAQEAYWAEVWHRLGRPDPGFGNLPVATPEVFETRECQESSLRAKSGAKSTGDTTP